MEKKDITTKIHDIIDGIIKGTILYEELGMTYSDIQALVPKKKYGMGTYILLKRRYEDECSVLKKYGNSGEEEIDVLIEGASNYLKYLKAYCALLGCGIRLDFEKMRNAIKVNDLESFVENVKRATNINMTTRNKKHPCYQLTIDSKENASWDKEGYYRRRTRIEILMQKTETEIRYLTARKLKVKGGDSVMESEKNTIDIAQLGASIGMEAKEQSLPGGRVVKSLVWDQETLQKAVKAVEHLSSEGKPVRITGAAPAWLVSALTHTVHPCPVSIYVPQIGKYVDIPQLTHGEVNKEGEVAFKITEKGDSVLIEYNMDLPEGITTYDENNLSKVVVPEIPQGKAVYISGRGPNYLTTAIAEAYAHTNSSVSLNQPGVGYTCAITHSRSKSLGDLTKDPLVQENIKEQLIGGRKTSECR